MIGRVLVRMRVRDETLRRWLHVVVEKHEQRTASQGRAGIAGGARGAPCAHHQVHCIRRGKSARELLRIVGTRVGSDNDLHAIERKRLRLEPREKPSK